MKKSEFIAKVLKSRSNTVFTTKEQVENAIEVFEKFGMEPPIWIDKSQEHQTQINLWEPENEEK
jgi:hypothetical protein